MRSSAFSRDTFPYPPPLAPERPAPSPCEARWPSEEEVHREHRDALEATLLAHPAAADELIFELENGRLHARRR